MSLSRDMQNETFAILDAAMTVLNNYPELAKDKETYNITSINPLQFVLDLIKNTMGYDAVLNLLARFISYSLPSLEAAVKAVILSSLKQEINCSVNPVITTDVLNKGVVVTYDELNMLNTLDYSPLDERIGKYLYAGNENVETIGQLKNANDMNSFIWYMFNCATMRRTWSNRSNKLSKFTHKITNFINQAQSKIGDILLYPSTATEKLISKLSKNEDNTTPTGEGGDNKKKKSDAVITIERNGNVIHNADGTTQYTQTNTSNNSITVYYGNATYSDEDENAQKIDTLEDEIDELKKDLKRNKKAKKNEIKVYKQNISDIKKRTYRSKQEKNDAQRDIEEYQSKINTLEEQIKQEEENTKKSIDEKQTEIFKIQQSMIDESHYKSLSENYLLNTTLLDFNLIYLSSISLFDEKVVAARLIETLVNGFAIDLNLTFEQIVIREEIKKIVTGIMKTNDISISDCFFTFSNKDYDKMSRKTELAKAGIIPHDEDALSNKQVDLTELLSNLNDINPNSSKEEINTIIEGTLTKISNEITIQEAEYKTKMNPEVKFNLGDKLIEELSYVLISEIFGPKVYLLYLINYKTMKQERNFILEDFLNGHMNMLEKIIMSIRDEVIQYFVAELMKTIRALAVQLGLKIKLEQIQYYIRLIRSCIECWKNIKNNTENLDWDMSKIGYADIYEQPSTETTEDNC